MTTPSSTSVAANPMDPTTGKPTPAPPPNIAPQPPLQAGISSKRFMSNISVEFKGKTTTSLRDRITTLLAVLHQADNTIQLHPFDKSTTAPTISTAAEVPPDDVSAYVSKEKVLKNGTLHYISLSSAIRLSSIKQHPNVKSHISKHDIWLRPHSIRSHDITNVGFIFRKNCDAHSRHEIYDEMVTSLNGKFKEFQLIARYPFYKKGITTRGWMLQMDKADSAQWLAPMLQAFPLRTSEIGIQLVPFLSAAQDKNKSMLKLFLYQNKWLQEQTVIRVDNLRGLSEKLIEIGHPNDTTTIRSHFLNITVADSVEPLFLSVSQYNSGRTTFLVKTKHYQEAIEYVDELIDTYIDTQLEPASRAAITFPNRPPIRIGRSKIPEVIEPTVIQVSALTFPEFDVDLNDEDSISVWSNHRAGSSYASVAATATSSTDTQSSPSPPSSHLPAKRSSDDSKIATKQAEIDQLLASIKTKNTELETEQDKLAQAVETLQASTASTLQEVHRINTAITRTNETLASHSQQMTQHNTLLQELIAGMNDIRSSLSTQLSSPPRKLSRLTHTTTMDGVQDTTGLDLSQRFHAQARFVPPPAASLPPPIPEENDDNSELSEGELLYSNHTYHGPLPNQNQPPDPRHQRQTE